MFLFFLFFFLLYSRIIPTTHFENKKKTNHLFPLHRSEKNGRRLGYMGHLIDMFDSLNLLVLVSHQFRALVESNLSEQEVEDWKSITDPTDGKLAAELKAQKSFLVRPFFLPLSFLLILFYRTIKTLTV